MLLVLALCLCLTSPALAGGGYNQRRVPKNDAQLINPKECGINRYSQKTRSVYKRYVSGDTPDQRNWGWEAVITDKNRQSTSGTLINTRWILTRAKFAK
jgi:hypothetical protein